MHEASRQGTWLRHLAVVTLYFAAYSALRQVSFAFWFLPAGLRLLCLLFVPYRYWAALAFGEMLGLGKVAYQCYESLGPVFALLNLVPRIIFEMPIVRWCQQRLGLLGPKRQIRMNVLLLCTLLTSAVTAACDYLFVYIIPTPAGQELPALDWMAGYFLGKYLGVLTVAPVALMLWQAVRVNDWRSWGTRLASSRFAMESAVILLPTLGLLMWAAVHANGQWAMAARIAMFLPVAALSMRYGWYGAAVGGSAASIGIAIVMPVIFDPMTTQAQVFMSFAITVLLMLGARISVLHVREHAERLESRLVLQSAQQGLYLGELRMQQAADTLQQVTGSLYRAHERLLDRMRLFLPEGEERRFSRQAAIAQQEVFSSANGLSPRAWQTEGAVRILSHGSIAHALEAIDVAFDCDIKGAALAESSPGFQLALYRLACEAVVYLHEQASLSCVRLRVRVGLSRGRYWAVLQMTGTHLRGDDRLMPSRRECIQFRERLGAMADGIEGIRHSARVYRGAVHARSLEHATRLSLGLQDGENLSGRPQ